MANGKSGQQCAAVVAPHNPLKPAFRGGYHAIPADDLMRCANVAYVSPVGGMLEPPAKEAISASHQHTLLSILYIANALSSCDAGTPVQE
jgi:hypothetical protein